MIIILTISTWTIILCILLHFNQHFRCRSCREEVHRLRESHSFQTVQQREHPQKQLCRFNWCCGVRNDEEFDFFPISFLLYTIFMAMISILIIIKYIYEETTAFDHYYHYSDSYISRLLYFDDLLNNTVTNTSKLTISTHLDWILYILIFIAMCWESLFSFYRYYTTIMSAKYLYSSNFKGVFKPFIIYIIGYLILFTVQTQIYYWLFPIVFLCYFIMNMYWIWKVAYVLLISYAKLKDSLNAEFAFNNFQSGLVHSVKIMRNLSIISSIFSSIYVAAFIIIYDMKIIYYFPSIWSLSITSFVFNFIRNRQSLQDKVCCLCHHKYIASNKNHKMPSNAILELAPTNSIHLNEKGFVVCIENIDGDKKEKEEEKEEKQISDEPPSHRPHHNTLVDIENYVAMNELLPPLPIHRESASLPIRYYNQQINKNNKHLRSLLHLNSYISHSDDVVIKSINNNNKTNESESKSKSKGIESPTSTGMILAVEQRNDAASKSLGNLPDYGDNKNHSKTISSPISRIAFVSKFNLHRPKELPLINTSYHDISINNNRTKSSPLRKKRNKALVLLGLTPSQHPTTPILYAPSVTPSVHINDEDLNDGTIICDDDYLNHSRLKKPELSVIDSSAPVSPPSNPRIIKSTNNYLNSNYLKRSAVGKTNRSQSDATSYYDMQRSPAIIKGHKKMPTPQSANQVQKYGKHHHHDLSPSNLLLDIYEGTTFDTECNVNKTAPVTPRRSDNKKRNSYSYKTENSSQVSPAGDLVIPQYPQSPQSPQSPESPQKRMGYLRKPMSALTIPKSQKTNNVRSSSNPLLMNYRTDTLTDLSCGQSGEYEYSFTELDKMQRNTLNAPVTLPLEKNIYSVPPPQSNIDEAHKKVASHNDATGLMPFTLIDALQRIQNQRKGTPKTTTRRKSRHKRHHKNKIAIPPRKGTGHSQRESVSVVSVLNLFVAQGFCDKKSVNSVHQIQQLTAPKTND